MKRRGPVVLKDRTKHCLVQNLTSSQCPGVLPIPELGEDMTFGRSCESLRKSWYALKRNRAEGSYHNKDLEFRINRIQNGLGFALTPFDDLDQEWVDNELSMEQPLKKGDEEDDEELSQTEQLNQQLKKEERNEELAGWGLEEEGEEDDE